MSQSSSRFEELVELAAVVRAHGLKGELLLKPFNPDSELWPSLERIVLRSPAGEERAYAVTRGHVHGANVILGLEGLRDKDAADALRGSLVCVPRASLPETDDDEHYFVDLIGLEVRDEAGAALGKVREVLEYPSVACLLVELADGTIEVPHLERYVLAIDVAEGFVTVAHLDELDVLRASAKGTR